MNYPVWINADIIAGPVENVNTVPVDPVSGFAKKNFAFCFYYFLTETVTFYNSL